MGLEKYAGYGLLTMRDTSTVRLADSLESAAIAVELDLDGYPN